MGWDLKIKNFNIIGVHWKIWFFFFGGGVMKKPIPKMDCLRRGAGTVCRFKSAPGKKEKSGVFEEWLTLQCTLWKEFLTK